MKRRSKVSQSALVISPGSRSEGGGSTWRDEGLVALVPNKTTTVTLRLLGQWHVLWERLKVSVPGVSDAELFRQGMALRMPLAALDGKNLLELTQTVALISMLEKNDSDSDSVQLATLHAAKGLEFKHVFLVGVEEGILPHRDAEAEGRIEEERRLMYVGITRAERSLHLSWCLRRKQGKEWRNCEPSRFIAEMNPGSDDMKISGGKDTAPPDKAAGRAKLALFRAMLGGP